MRTLKKANPWTLLVGLHPATAIMENNMKVPQELPYNQEIPNLYSFHPKFPSWVLSLNYAIKLAMNEFRLKHVDHVVEVNQVIIDGNDIHFARVKSGPGDQAPNTVKSIYSHIIHCVLGLWLALHQKMQLLVQKGGTERA